MTEWGETLHAYLPNYGHALCGMRRGEWFPPDPDAPLCARCGEMYGVAFPAPPGRPHHSADLPWFDEYEQARASA